VTLLLVALGAAIGAPARYLIDRAVTHQRQARSAGIFPWGTLTVNVLGSFVLGFVLTLGVPAPARALVGTGFCGALTTYSTFSYETLRLAEEGALLLAVANVVGSVVAGLLAVAAGWGAAQLLGALI
jgi:CrcB protein